METPKTVPPPIEAIGVAFAKRTDPTRPRTQVKQHRGPHRGPAQAGACPDSRIDVLHAGDAGLHKMQRFPPQRCLQAICNVAGYLTSEPNRDLSDVSIELLRLLDHSVLGERVRKDLH